MSMIHLQPKLETKLATHYWTRDKMIILLKLLEIQDAERIIENGAKKWIQGVKLEGEPSIYRYNG